ncbi:MAG: hypothetical protein AAGC74_08775 [Verrucomicrobiota bacterium]
MRKSLLLLPLAILACSAPSQTPTRSFNQTLLQTIKTFPTGGGYSGTDATKNLLPLASQPTPDGLLIIPTTARPSFCSGATYLAFLQTLNTLSPLQHPLSTKLAVATDQQDGHGIFGRWNANGPGCAKLIADLNLGTNFTKLENAQPGDFLKIWWTEHIGKRERGHHVVYLSHTPTTLTFWSSNQPHGYGQKTVPLTNCKRLLFTRITKPQNITNALTLTPTDPYLASMLTKDHTWPSILKKTKTKTKTQ